MDQIPPIPPRQQILPHFTPVPREKERHNGWKPEVQRAFIEALAETGSVRSAARRVNRAEVGAYLLRRHPKAEEFRKAWDAALDIGMRRIEDVAMDRALNGVDVPLYSYGKLVGSRTVYNDRLLMFMLRNRAPERFCGGRASGLNAVDKMQTERLKKQWRAEWDAERAAEEAKDDDQVLEELNAKFARHHQDWLSRMGPRTRVAYEAYRRTEAEEAGKPWKPIDWPRPFGFEEDDEAEE
ncbi:hypothetical protein OKA06_08215 [Novosphingobium sp. MW5]|nr:hypothetical protein [Novosphingobium sp. MW5]